GRVCKPMRKTPFLQPALCLGLTTSLLLLARISYSQSTDAPPPIQRLDPQIQKIVADISDDRVADIMRKLETFGTRNTVSDPKQKDRGIGVAWQWIYDQFKSYSPRLQVSFDSYQLPKSSRVYKEIELVNVVAILPGKMKEATNRWILI